MFEESQQKPTTKNKLQNKHIPKYFDVRFQLTYYYLFYSIAKQSKKCLFNVNLIVTFFLILKFFTEYVDD